MSFLSNFPQKSASQGSTAPRPELCVDLNGALIDQVDRGDKASVTSRKNVFLVSTVLGLQVLFQCDCSQLAEEWYNAVHTAIHNLVGVMLLFFCTEVSYFHSQTYFHNF